MEFSIGCMNVRGIRNREKRRDILNFMRNKDFSIVCLVDTHLSCETFDFVRAEWGGSAIFCPGTSHSRGIAVFFSNNFGFEVFGSQVDDQGNFIILDVELAGPGRCTFVVLYGPNEDNPGFYRSVFSLVGNIDNDNVVIVGDWNVTLNPSVDTEHYVSQGNRRAREVILEFMEKEGMVDVWREQHAAKRSYTWRRSSPLRLGRLDYFLVSSAMSRLVSSSFILPGYRSDHSLISILISEGMQSKRGLYWKFNNSLLKDSTYIDLVNSGILEVKRQYAVPLYTSDEVEESNDIALVIDDQLFFEVLLCKIRGLTISYGARKKRERDRREEALLLKMQILEGLFGEGESYRQRLVCAQQELSDLRRIKLAGAAQRACVRWVQEGESPTRYFCGLEKRQSVAKYIACLNVEGELVNDNDKVLDCIETHFSNLYKARAEKNINHCQREIGYDYPKLTPDESRTLEGLITLKEAAQALRELRNDKSPGPDGFSVNFFKFFWRQIGGFLVRSLNSGYDKNLLSCSQRQGIITLIPKGKKPKEFIKNWRPISLLNTTFKILSRVMANRVRLVIDKLIGQEQKGFMKGRYIGECTRTVYDVMWEAKHSRNSSNLMLLLADFQSAFDSLDHTFIQDVLKMFSFGESFRKWIRVMFAGAESTVCQNGTSTQFFNVERGCRQGDCCSPLVFVLCVEILAIMVRNNPQIRGWVRDGKECKIEQYADDTTFILDGTRGSLNACLSTLQAFGEVSGLTLNAKKTQVFCMGSGPSPAFLADTDLSVAADKFTLLGIEFTKAMTDMSERNVRRKVVDIANLLKGWLRRRLSLYGKRTVVKTLALPMLTHILSALPSPPKTVFHDLQVMFFRFIWDNKQDKIKRSVMYTRFNVPNVTIYDSALKVTWIKRAVLKSDAFWNILLNSGEFRFKEMLGTGDSSAKYFLSRSRDNWARNLFWRDVFQCWDVFKASCGLFDTDVDPIHLCTKLLIGGSPFWNRALFDAGCRWVKDLYRSDGTLKSFEELNLEFHIPFSRTVLQGLIRAVRRTYGVRIEVRELVGPERPKALECLFTNVGGNLSVYRLLIAHQYPASSDLTNAEVKWNRDLNDEIEWSTLYWRHRNYTRNKKIIWFQDRLLHRILTTNLFISKFTDADPSCAFCKNFNETLLHLFCHCNAVVRLWSEVERAAVRSGLSINLEDKNIILNEDVAGGNLSDSRKNLLCQIVLLFKFYIYRTKVASSQLSFKLACVYVKSMVVADRPIIDHESSNNVARIDEAYRWAIDMLEQWIGQSGQV